jgi:ssDNA-binding Zn-finger/Zn-ribbon topoisomerase 1
MTATLQGRSWKRSMRKIYDLMSLFRQLPTAFTLDVLGCLFEHGFDSTLSYCPDGNPKIQQFRFLEKSLYKKMQKNVVAKAALNTAKCPRIILNLYWYTEGWERHGELRGRFMQDMDVETRRKGWEFRLQRSLAMMEEVAEDKQTNNKKCPKCNGLMIERKMESSKTVNEETGRTIGPMKEMRVKEFRHPHHGEWFWGCLKYPECRGMIAYWIPADQDKDVGNIVKDVTCPECDSRMVVRQARRGSNAGNKFLGCIAYPVCKGTMSMEKALALVLMRGDK